MPVEDNEAIEPRRFNQPVEVVARHLQRYLDAVKLYGEVLKVDEYGEGLLKHAKALDYGAGSGYGACLLFEFFGKVVAYDPKPANNAGAIRTNICMVTNPPDAEFEAIFCIEMIEHVSRQHSVGILAQMSRMLSDGGSIVLSTPISPLPNPNPTNPHHSHEYSLQELMSVFTEVGLVVVGSNINTTTFTDGETKGQGLFVIKRAHHEHNV